jgi:hypothetical protein
LIVAVSQKNGPLSDIAGFAQFLGKPNTSPPRLDMRMNSHVCRRVFSLLAFVAVVALFTANFSSLAVSQTAPSRITQTINESDLVILRGNTRPEANLLNDRGAVPDAFAVEHVSLLLQRSPEQEQELVALIDQLNDKTSPNFHQWLTPEEFGERFGVSQADIDTITGWLKSHGFTINNVYANRMLIDFSGNAGQIRSAFHTEIHNLEVKGESHLANMGDPQIPVALAPVVKGVVSLNDFKPHAMNIPKTEYTFISGTSTLYAVTAQDNAVIYNLNPLWSAGISGQGQTIYIAEDSDAYTPTGGTFATDWNTYRSTFGLSGYSGTLTQVHPGSCTDPGGVAGTEGEVAIDIEVSSSIAPSAAIELITCKDPTLGFGGLTAMQNLFNTNGATPGVVSLSYGECEAASGAGLNAAFYSAYQQASSEGFSVFVSSGDEGPTGCGNEFTNGSEYDVASLSITGWGETPYNVSVGGTDFEDVYNAVEGGSPLSTYWSSTNTPSYGSALQYVPEIPWNDSCASVLLSEALTGSFTTYGTSGTCNNSSFDTSTTYLSTGAGAGGASSCATGSAGLNQTDYLISSPECQGYPKPSWQSGSTLTGGQAVYGVPSDAVRDIPDVSMFAANGVWSHYEIVCFSNTSRSAGGASCAGAPSTWAGYGGTSVASPSMAAVQALVNQKTGTAWGNPNPIYYQIAQNEYGTAGSSFLGSSCSASASGGPANSCVFHDVTQGDIDLACENNGTVEEAHCYLPSGTHGVVSTDAITAASVINGGSGYTSAPTCAVAGPSNGSPYLAPTGATLYAGGAQASCTASVSSSSSTAVWSIVIESKSASGQKLVFTNNSGAVLATYTLSGSSTTAIASALVASINGGGFATATSATATVTATATTAGYAGNFYVIWGSGWESGESYAQLTQTTAGQGPNYVSGITITAGGSGYAPETPVTLTGGGGSGAIAVANTSPGTGASSYQPTYGAAPGYDLATGLGTPNAYNMVCSSAWSSTPVCTTTAVSSSQNPSAYGQAVSFTATVTGNSPTGTVQFNIDGSAFGSPVTLSGGSATSGSTTTLAVGTHTVTAVYSGDSQNVGSTGTLGGGQVVTIATSTTSVSSSLNPSTYGQSVSFTATVTGGSPTGTVQFNIDSSPFGSAVTLSGGSASSGSISTLAQGTHTVTAVYSGDSNNSGSTGTLSGGQVVQTAGAGTITVSTTGSPSTYGQSVTFTATIPGQYNFVKKNGGVKSQDVTGTVAWSSNTGCGTTNVTSGNPGTATCTTTSLSAGTDTVTANYSGDSNHNPGSGSTSQSVNQASTTISVISVSPSNEDYGLDSPVTITAQLSWSGSGSAPTAANVSISGNGNGTYGAPSCGAASGDTISCSATYTPTPADGPGFYTESASFSGDTNYTGSSSSQTNNFTINTATSSTSVSSSVNPSSYGQSVTFTATISGENGNVKGRVTRNGRAHSQDITGTVTWSANTGCGTIAVTDGGPGNPGTATCTTSSLPTGTDTITATYSGDSNHGGSTGTLSGGQQVNGGVATSINVTNVNPSSEAYGQDAAVAITAVLGWSGGGAAPNASNITISGNGNGSYGATSCGSPSGDTITCTATYSPSTADTPGSYTESAAFSGDSNYAASSSPQTGNFSIGAATSTVAVGSSQNPSNYQQSVTFTATISGEFGNVKGRVTRNGRVKSQDITGNVTWSSNTGCGTTPVTDGGPGNPGTATCTTSSLPGGTDTITATYNGDGNHSGNTGTLSGGQVVNPLNQTITFSTNAPASAVYNSSFTVAASASSGLPVSYTSAGGCSNSGATYTMTSGTTACSVIANQAGNNDYSAAPPVTQTTNATLASQSITVTTAAPTTAAYNSSFTVVASASSGLPITYASSGACSNTGATYTMTSGSGICTAKLSQPGNGNYSAASTITETTTATEASQTVSFTGAPSSAAYGTSFTVSATSNSGITPLITTSSQCSASGDTITIETGSGTCTMTATWNGNGNYKSATAIQTTTAIKATPVITWATPAPINYGIALSGTQLDASSNLSGGTFKYTPASGKILTAGTQTLSVTYTPASKADYNTVTATVSLQVNQDSTTTTITSSDKTLTLNRAGTASTVLDFNVSTYYKPTGAVTLTATTGETCTGNVAAASGNGSCKLTFTTSGTRTITASYSGDDNHTASNSDSQNPPVTVTVNPFN